MDKSVSDLIWQGRPDILVEVYERHSNQLVKPFIGEVKNTSDIGYALQGLEELIDYIHFVKDRRGGRRHHFYPDIFKENVIIKNSFL